MQYLMLLKYLSIGLMSSSGVGDSIGRPGAVPFSVAHHGQLVFLALGAVFVVWMLCRFVVDLIHRGNLIDPALTLSSIDSASINSIISNDMAALLGTVAGMSTLSLAVSNTLPVHWTIVLTVVSGALGFLSAGYWISSNRSASHATYSEINKTRK